MLSGAQVALYLNMDRVEGAERIPLAVAFMSHIVCMAVDMDVFVSGVT